MARQHFSKEMREKVVRLARFRPDGDARSETQRHADVAAKFGMSRETVRLWVRQAEIDEGTRVGTTTSDAERIAQLERENRELRRVNEILKTASAFFAAAELDRKIK